MASVACATPAPTSAAGYAAMFRAVDPAQFGAADGYLSLHVGARVVWFFGDTAATSWAGFHHSTAITQTGGCLHVSHAGAQILPDDPDGSYYWMGSFHAYSGDRIVVKAARLTPGTGQTGTRYALLHLTREGNIIFDGWISPTNPADLAAIDSGSTVAKEVAAFPHGQPWGTTILRRSTGAVLVSGVGPYEIPGGDYRFSYNAESHEGIRLASGRLLVSLCWNTWQAHPLADGYYAPTWYEVAP